MISKLGIFSIIAGLVLGLFALLSQFTGSALFLSAMTMSTLFEGITGSILDRISSDAIYNALYLLFYETHLAGILTGLGVTLLVIGTFIRKD